MISFIVTSVNLRKRMYFTFVAIESIPQGFTSPKWLPLFFLGGEGGSANMERATAAFQTQSVIGERNS